MSLEIKIEELTLAVTRLTEVLLRDAPQYQTPEEKKTLKAKPEAKAKVAKKVVEETVDIEELIEEAEVEDNFDIEDEAEEVALDAETVKSLAKQKMIDGSIQRDVLKAEVKKLGADMISELKAEALVKLYDKLNNLKK